MGMYDKDEYDSNDGDGLSEMGSQHCGSTITSAPGTTLREMERRMSSRRAGGAATIAAATSFLAPPPRRPASSFHGSVGGGSGNGGKTNKNMSNRNHGRTVVSPHQETKDSVISDPENHDDPQDDDDSQVRSYYSRDSFSTRDPEGVYDDDCHDDDGPPNTVEEYAAMARRRASRMTHVNFDRHRRRPHDGALAIVAPHGDGAEGTVAGRSVTSRSSSTGSRSERRAKRRARVEKSKDDLLQRYDEERTTATTTVHHPEPDPDPERRRQDSRKNHSFVGNGDVDLLDSHPADHNALAVIPVHAPADEAAGGGGPPPIHPSDPQTMVGSHILAPSSDASTSSTVSSITSVDSYMRQQILLKELEKYKKEREWMRREREEGRRRKATTVLVEEDEEEEGEGDYEYEYEYDDREEHDDDDEEEAFHENGRERTRTRGASIASPRSRPPEHRHRNDHRRHPATGTRARSLTPTRQQQRRRQRQPDTASRSVKSFHSPTMHNHRYPPSPHRPSWQSQSRSHSRSPSRSSRGNRTRDSRSSRGGWGSYISGASENTSYYSDDEESTYYYHHRNHPSASVSVSPPHSNQSTSFRSGTSSPPPPPSRHRRRRSSSRSTATRSHRSSSKSRTSSRASDATAATPPVYQLEECCIKHPDVLLSDQTDVRVWTCMRYCKDEKSGRWITVKKVCRVCLDEMEGGERGGGGGGGGGYDDGDVRSFGGRDAPEEGSYYAHHHGSRIRRSSHSNDRSHPSNYYDSSTSSSSSWNHDEHHLHHHPHDDGTASLTDSRYYYHDDDDDAAIMKDTINVHPTFGEDGNQTPLEREAEAQRRRFIRRLAARAYHFPGNTWCEDWMQYMSNTHLVLGIFFHHPLHPVTGRERCIILLGSVAVGLLMSNLIYLWFVHANIDTDEAVISIGIDSLNVTKLMITLWTLGSVVHTLFDLSVWHIKACTLCRYGGNVSDEAMKCGRTAGVTIVLSTLAFATYLVLLRASSDYNKEMKLQLAAMGDFESNEQEEEEETANVFFESISLAGGAQSFDFLAGYIIEFILAVFVYNPLILTVVFTGMLGCNGRIPVLGGRPREVAKEQRYAMKRQRYTMPQTLKLGDEEFEADMWGDANQKLATNF